MPDLSKTTCQILKIDTDRRLVTAIASTVTDPSGQPIVDYDEDIIAISELEKAFIEAFAHGGADRIDDMHEGDPTGDIVQQFTFSRQEWGSLQKAITSRFGESPDLSRMPEMGIIKVFVRDDDLWAKIKAGMRPELSIAGVSVRERIDS